MACVEGVYEKPQIEHEGLRAFIEAAIPIPEEEPMTGERMPPEMPSRTEVSKQQLGQTERQPQFTEMLDHLQTLNGRLHDLRDRTQGIKRRLIGHSPKPQAEQAQEDQSENLLATSLRHLKECAETTEKINTLLNDIERELPQ